jgi:L,D-transpeptidase catalytic domain
MMIDRQELAAALARLDPRDREVLDYSMRRHVPDEDLAAVFDCGPSDVARLRAAAVERLADDLKVQRGADLGQVLTALLDRATWEALPAPESPAPAAPPEAAEAVAPTGASGEPEDEEKKEDDDSEKKGPVLGMLARGYGREGRTVAAQAQTAANGRRRWPAVAVAAVVALLALIGAGSVVVLGGDGSSEAANEDGGTRPFEPRQEAIGEPFPSDPASAYRYPVAIVERTTTLYDDPNGKPKLRISAKTEWDSPRVLSVVEREGDWLAVLVPELENGEVAWVQEDEADRLDTVGWAVKADLSRRTIEVERDGEVVRRFKIGVGRDDHPTPPGRYAVTDKLSVTDPGSPYGCCVVALTGHQTRLPDGWPGGDRLAIHATADLSGLGHAVSLGCMRVDPKDARWLLDVLPLGAPVFVSE